MFDVKKLEWTREPEHYNIAADKIEMVTKSTNAEYRILFIKTK